MATPSVSIDYRIDGRDRLVWVGPGWAPFAVANDAPGLAEPLLGQPIWSSIVDDNVRRVWQLVVERLRAAQASITVPFRCDAPAARRWFEMTMTATDDRVVHFRSVLLAEELRPPVAVLDARSIPAAPGPLLKVCSWCCRCHDGSDWVQVEDLVRTRGLLDDAPIPALTHGICPSCSATLEAALTDP